VSVSKLLESAESAGIQDRDGGISLFADSAYQGPLFAKALAKILPRLFQNGL
jgi:hypothetical protein